MAVNKILIPVLQFGRAGGFRVLSELGTRWTSMGYTVDFLAHERLPSPYFPTSAGILSFNDSGHVWRKATPSIGEVGEPWGPALYWGMCRALTSLGGAYDVILANHSLSAWPVFIARSGRARKFYYIQAHEPGSYELRKGWKFRVLQALSAASYRLPLYRIVNSPIYLSYRGIRAKEWIPPGLDEKLFFRRLAPPRFAPDRPWTIGTIGRSEEEKGTRFVLRGFEILAKVDPFARLAVAFGNLPAGWRHERSTVIVPQSDAELADFYRSIDILVAVPTQQFGAVHYPVIEGMACGTPVLNTGYLPADEQNSWLVPPFDSNAIVDALLRIKSTPVDELDIKLERAARATHCLHWDAVASQFIRLLEGTVG